MGVSSIRYPACKVHIAILPSVTSPAVQYSSTLCHKSHDFRKKELLNIKCVFLLSLQGLSETFLIIRRTKRVTCKYIYCSPCEVPLFLTDFNENWIFLTAFRKLQISNFITSFQWKPSCCIRTNEQTDVMKAIIITFRNFSKALRTEPT